jgi:hypothetical protein
VTRLTAFNAIDVALKSRSRKKTPFVFVSAAETGWTSPSPVEWLERYLVAKRAVESRLGSEKVREIILRPSLIWTWQKPLALISVIPFYIGNKFLPFVDKPVLVDTLCTAAWEAIESESEQGVLRFMDMERLKEESRQ